MNNDDDNAQANAGDGAQADGAGGQANAGGGAQGNGVPGAQVNGVAGGQGHGGGGLPPNAPIHPIPDPNDGGPQTNGRVGHAHDDDDDDDDENAAEIQANVNNGLAGLNQALQYLNQGMNSINQGVNLLEFEPVVAEAVLLNRPATVSMMRACLSTMWQATVRIQGSLNDIVGRFEYEPEVQIFPAEIRQISVTARLISSSALAVHSFLVYNADCHVDNSGAHGTIQEGLGHVNVALTMFQTYIARFLGYEDQQGFVWEDNADEEH